MNKLIVIIAFSTFFINANCQIDASFTANDSTGCNSLIVQFENTSTGTETLNYIWNFGNGTTSTLKNPKVVYNTLGAYTVSLIVTSANYADTIIKTNYIHVFKNPNINQIIESESKGCQPLQTSFTYNYAPGDAPIKNAIWDFGDGESSTEPNPQHNYKNYGFYSVSVFILDTNGCESSLSQPNLIEVLKTPGAAFSSSNNISCLDTLTVNFQNKSTASTSLTYMWDFGNYNTSTQENPTMYYSGFNTYTVKLKVSDNFGCTDSIIKTNYVNLQQLTVNATILKSQLCKSESISISNNTTGANKYFWDFGDGTTSQAAMPQKKYSKSGDFNIVYVAWFGNSCSDTLTFPVFVDSVKAAFHVNQTYGCEFPFKVQYTNESYNAQSWHWMFGDSTNSSLINPEVSYTITNKLIEKRNMYLNDTLIATSALNCKDTIIVDSNIHLHYPYIHYSPKDTVKFKNGFSGCIPIFVEFDNESENYNDDDPIANWNWDFGDGNTSNLRNPDYTYNTEGEYNIRLTATNQSGCANSFETTLLAGTPQTAKFSYTGAPVVCGSNVVQMNNQSSNTDVIDTYSWAFSDKTTIQGKDIAIQFADTGYISGILKVTYNGCESEPFNLDSFVYVNGPAGGLKLALNCDQPFIYQFTSGIAGADFWYFDFGDGYYDSTQVINTTHTYSTTGNYKSHLIASNSTTGCSLDKMYDVLVRDLQPHFANTPQIICPGNQVWYNAAATIDEAFYLYNDAVGKYLWRFDDTTVVFSAIDSVSHVFYDSGKHKISLSVKDANGCTDSVITENKVFNVSPQFTYSDSIGCSPFTVDLFDATVADTVLSKWFWYVNNEKVDSVQNISKTLSGESNYTISLIVSDINGCTDTITKENILYSSNPVAIFNSSKTNYCFQDSVQFLNLSEGKGINTFYWDFGDGQSSNEKEPKIALSDTGFFDVSLQIIDSLGCDTTLLKSNYIYIEPIPQAGFISNTFSSLCYPKIIGFTDTSIAKNIQSRFWDFGDGETNSNNAKPYHTYQKPGLFDISLIVNTTNGCTDTVVQEGFINIGGPYAEINAPDSSCINIPITISFNNELNIFDFNWTLDDGSQYNENPFNKDFSLFGNKKLYLSVMSDSLGTCDKLIKDSIFIPELIARYSISDSANCVPYTINTSNYSLGASNYKWFLNDSLIETLPNLNFDLINAGNQQLKLLAQNSVVCSDSLIKNLEVFPLPVIEKNNDTLICQYDTISLSASGGVNYYWYLNNSIVDSLLSTILVSPNNTNHFRVKVIDTNTCVNNDSILVRVQLKPNLLIINKDTTLIIGEQIELNSEYTVAENILWQPLEGLSCQNCISPIASPLESTKYTFSVWDNNNCFLLSDSVFIKVDAKYSVDMPNSFTPNGDGVNDVVYVQGWGIKELIDFTVYDIGGRKVFTTNNIQTGWDGLNQAQGMYIYEVRVYSYDDTERLKKGYIYLLK